MSATVWPTTADNSTNVIAFVTEMYDLLVTSDPDNSATYTANYESFPATPDSTTALLEYCGGTGTPLADTVIFLLSTTAGLSVGAVKLCQSSSSSELAAPLYATIALRSSFPAGIFVERRNRYPG